MAARYRELGWLGKTVLYFEQPGVHHFAWDFAYRDASLFGRLAPVRREPLARASRLLDLLAPLQQGLLAADRPHRPRVGSMARIEAGARRDGCFDVKTDEPLGLLAAARSAPWSRAGAPLEVNVDGEAGLARDCPGPRPSAWRRTARGRWIEKPWSGPAVGPPDHAEATFLRRHPRPARRPRLRLRNGRATRRRTKPRARPRKRLADWGPERARPLRGPGRHRGHAGGHGQAQPGPRGERRGQPRGGAPRRASCPCDRTPPGTFAGAMRVAGPDAGFRLHYPNPLAPGRYVLVYGAASAESSRPAPPVRARPSRPCRSSRLPRAGRGRQAGARGLLQGRLDDHT